MASVSPLIESLNSGEMSPRMVARVGFDRYPSAAKMLRNCILYPQGGFTRRPGTRFVAEVKDSADATILIPFQFSQDDSYMVEAGDLYFRFYRRQGRITVDDTNAVISNGSFASNITGWDNRSTGSAAIAHDAVNGRLQLTGASGAIAWAGQSVAISVGNSTKEQVLRFRIEGFGGGVVGFQVGTTTIGDEVLEETDLGPGYHSIGFTPGATTFYVQFRNKNIPVRNMFVDDVELIDNAPMELTSPYTSAELADVRFFQAADVVFMLHPDHPPMRLERRGHKSWSVIEAFFEDGPYLEENPNFNEATHQVIVNPLFENGLEGWADGSSGGGTVVHDQDSFVVSLDNNEGSGAAHIQQQCTVDANKKHVLHVLTISKVGVLISIGTSFGGIQYLDKTAAAAVPAGWNSYEFTPTGSTIFLRLRYDGSHDDGIAGIGGALIYDQDAHLLTPSANDGTVTVTASGHEPFTTDDIGRLLRLTWPGREPGYGVITAYTSSTVVSVLVLRRFPSTAPTERWQLGAWSERTGYPTVMGFFDGRAVFSNTSEQPNTFWFAQSTDLQDMRPDSFVEGSTTVEDDDAIQKTLSSAQIDKIVWINGQKAMVVGTVGGQWIVDSTGPVVTPADTSAKQHTALPSANLAHTAVNQITVFADRSRRELHEVGFKFEEDSFVATDLTILADHILRSPAEQLVYQRRPYSTIWVRRTDGRLAALSYNRQHEVLGWSQSIIGGSFGSGAAVVESIAAIPGAEDSGQQYNSDERDELWMIVKRTVDGHTVRYIEFMEYFFDGPLREDYATEAAWRTAVRAAQVDAFFVDSGLTYDGVPATTITGLSHLEGESVKVLADGKVIADKTVSAGQITLSTAASKVHVGLSFRHRYESLKIAVGNPSGTAVNKVKIITGVGLVLLDTGTFAITTVDYDEDGRRQHDLYTVSFLRESMDPDEATPLYTGEIAQSTEGAYSSDPRIYCEGDAPLPFTLLGLAPNVETINAPPSQK